MNILLCAVGRRAYLVEYFKQVVHPMGGKVFAVNTTKEATGFLTADESAIVPSSNSPDYIDVLLALCKKWKISLLFSLHDWDAPAVSSERQKFLNIGVIPVVGSPELLKICLDKYETVQTMMGQGIPVPKTVLLLSDAQKMAEDTGSPLIVKPRWGQGSIGLFVVHSKDELEWAYRLSDSIARRFASICPLIDLKQPQVIVQEFIAGQEYGCDIINDLQGIFRRCFVKLKDGMRAGETDVAESVSVPQIATAAEKIGIWSKHLGCMDSDWMVKADGSPYLIELNPRFGGGYPFTHNAGANVPLACVNWAKGEDNDLWYANYKTGVRSYKTISLMTNSYV